MLTFEQFCDEFNIPIEEHRAYSMYAAYQRGFNDGLTYELRVEKK